ncbi:hypothetical protein [Actinophytocola sp. KF-1]
MEQVHLDTAGVTQGVQLGHDTASGRQDAMNMLMNIWLDIESRWKGEAKNAFGALYQLLHEDQDRIRLDGTDVTEQTDLAMRDTVGQDQENGQLFSALKGSALA